MTASGLGALLVADHLRLGALLDAALAGDAVAYALFRAGLLRHIGIEEKILLPAARRALGGEGLPVAAQLRADHAALAALLVPTPTSAILATIQRVLAPHDALEEGPEGMYARAASSVGEGEAALVERMRAAPEVPVAKHFDGPRAFEAIDRLLRAAGRGT